jgi:hypothetical protein
MVEGFLQSSHASPLRCGLIRPEAVLGTNLSSATSRKPWRRRASAKPANYLTQAGVKVTAFRLGDQGHHGNAHMVMLEKNNLQVAAAIAGWLARSVPAR